jgi:hypothetical protein
MYKCIILVVFTVLTACGQENTSSLEGFYRKVDDELEPFVKTFENEWGKDISFRVKLSIIPPDEGNERRAGVCYQWQSGKKIAIIDLDFYYTRTEKQVEQVVMHELGHCALNKGHDDTNWKIDSIIMPNSIMRSWAFNQNEAVKYETYWNRYMDELFDRNEFKD